jgi:hypothetical protein
MRRKLHRVAVVLAVGGAFAPPAQAGTRQDFAQSFTTPQPGAQTGMTLHVLYKDPRDPNAKPPALSKLVLRLPLGTRFDSSAVPVCSASDAELQALGPSACPAESRVGSGTFVALSGSPTDPFVGDDIVFNGGDSLIEDVLFKGTQTTAGTDRLHIDGSTLTANPPATPGGPPDGRTVPREITLQLDRHSGFITTPPSCPPAGSWLSSSTATFADGGSETDTSVQACRAPASPPRLRLAVSPRRVRADRRTRFAIAVHSPVAACRAGVRVRLGRARAVTDAAGRARLRTTLSRPGRRRAVAAKPGCGRALAAVVVEPIRRS